MSVERYKTQLEKLPREERAELAYFLLSSLEPEEEGAAAAWDAEISRRVSEIRSGTANGKPAEQVFAELHERYP
ncbi:MAG TPA: addiction module protein [Thermoanaerobaculia bacterium]|nr:addiction module protein [Thermoanaerobaculia bacterium]